MRINLRSLLGSESTSPSLLPAGSFVLPVHIFMDFFAFQALFNELLGGLCNLLCHAPRLCGTCNSTFVESREHSWISSIDFGGLFVRLFENDVSSLRSFTKPNTVYDYLWQPLSWCLRVMPYLEERKLVVRTGMIVRMTTGFSILSTCFATEDENRLRASLAFPHRD
ncbi:hypothetical protein PIB30_005408 [Stylosanthes scabra]|uniref:Uncharacterized protein n=1 Tax=Stylosanthes scabra TaxID=79078 RepID=A0ABU6X5N6_9FABA|nr:hypothetical protein [Stylosanthes scabra]